MGGAPGHEGGPAIGVVGDGVHGVGDADVVGGGRGAEVWAGFEEKDAGAGVLGEAGGKGGTGGATADDDVVVVLIEAGVGHEEITSPSG